MVDTIIKFMCKTKFYHDQNLPLFVIKFIYLILAVHCLNIVYDIIKVCKGNIIKSTSYDIYAWDAFTNK